MGRNLVCCIDTRRKENPMTRYYSINEVADLLRVPEHRIHYAHRSRKLDGPGYTFAGRRAYDVHDVERVAEHFGVDVPDKVLEQKQEERDRREHLEWCRRVGLFTKEDEE